MRVIIFNENDVENLRYINAERGVALEPTPIEDTTDFFLPARVLDDPDHEGMHDFLNTFPQKILEVSYFEEGEEYTKVVMIKDIEE